MAKKYYAILTSKGQMVITRNYDTFINLTFKKAVKCKKFNEYNKALEWLGLEIIRNNITKYYAIYYSKENMSIILLNKIYLKNYIEKKYCSMKSFRNISEALEWLETINNTFIKNYHAIYYPNKNYGVIYLNNLIKKENEEYSLEEKFEDILQANNWIILNMKNRYKALTSVAEDVLYFDSGTGRGIGTEVRVTDYLGNSLLEEIIDIKSFLTQYNTINLGEVENLQGELYGFYLALKIALKKDIKKIAGDNQTVLYRWTNGYFKTSLPLEVKELIEKTIVLKNLFFKNGGELYYISGKINPADLGFHK